jgi:hypothetical protein
MRNTGDEPPSGLTIDFLNMPFLWVLSSTSCTCMMNEASGLEFGHRNGPTIARSDYT